MHIRYQRVDNSIKGTNSAFIADVLVNTGGGSDKRYDIAMVGKDVEGYNDLEEAHGDWVAVHSSMAHALQLEQYDRSYNGPRPSLV